ncbi:MAG: GNAT family N-acetyltransferase [Cucumibacter sp.]
MGLEIRQAGPADIEGIVYFIGALADYERLSGVVKISPDDLRRDLFGPNPRVFCEIAFLDGLPAGFTLWYYSYSTFQGRHGIWLEDLFVEQAHRGKGIGRALMAQLAAKCSAEGLGRLAWWVLDWNQKSIGFYRALGATLQSEWSVCRIEGAELAALGEHG